MCTELLSVSTNYALPLTHCHSPFANYSPSYSRYSLTATPSSPPTTNQPVFFSATDPLTATHSLSSIHHLSTSVPSDPELKDQQPANAVESGHGFKDHSLSFVSLCQCFFCSVHSTVTAEFATLILIY